MSTTEKRVIGGLKQLTEFLFKQHFKSNGQVELNAADTTDEATQSDEVSSSIELPSDDDVKGDKENNSKTVPIHSSMDSAMHYQEAELFCGMVVEQLTTTGQRAEKPPSDEWHRGQLDAYNLAHKRLFDKSD